MRSSSGLTWCAWPVASSIQGCFKSIAFLVYDGYNGKLNQPTASDIVAADRIQQNRTCDADCYGPSGCDVYKAFSTDQVGAVEQLSPL
jgi:hypothetical protein